ncbi:hypothetical protein R6Q59_012468 [Mikania micrantha]
MDIFTIETNTSDPKARFFSTTKAFFSVHKFCSLGAKQENGYNRYGKSSNGGSKHFSGTRGYESTKNKYHNSHHTSSRTIAAGTSGQPYGPSGGSGLSPNAYRRHLTPATSSSSEDQINIKQNIDKNSQPINATMKTPLQTSFSYSVSRLFSSLTEDYSLITCQRSMRTVLSLTTQLEFDFQKEMEML